MPEKNTRKSQRRSGRDTEGGPLAIRSSGSEIASIFDEFMRPFDDLMRPFEQFMEPLFPRSMRSFFSDLSRREPNFDIQDRGDKFVVTAELPSFGKDDVEVRVNPTSLEVKAQKKTDDEKKTKDGTESRRSYSYFHRYFTLPEQVVTEKVEGTMKNGVLELKLPKKEGRMLADKTRRVDLK